MKLSSVQTARPIHQQPTPAHQTSSTNGSSLAKRVAQAATSILCPLMMFSLVGSASAQTTTTTGGGYYDHNDHYRREKEEDEDEVDTVCDYWRAGRKLDACTFPQRLTESFKKTLEDLGIRELNGKPVDTVIETSVDAYKGPRNQRLAESFNAHMSDKGNADGLEECDAIKVDWLSKNCHKVELPVDAAASLGVSRALWLLPVLTTAMLGFLTFAERR